MSLHCISNESLQSLPISAVSIVKYFSQKDYVCFDFVPRHHNIIRFRRGLAVIKDDFSTVCSWVQFKNKEEWKYDMLLCKFDAKTDDIISIFGISDSVRMRINANIFFHS